MLVGEVDVANLLLAGQDHHHDLRRLHKVHRLGHRPQQESGNANRPAARLRGVGGLAGKHELVALAHDLPGPGLQDRSAEIGELFGRLLSGHAEFVIGHVRTRGVLTHRAGAARGRDELAIIGVPADVGAGCEVGCEFRRYVLRHGGKAGHEINRAGENAGREASCMSAHWKPPRGQKSGVTAFGTGSAGTLGKNEFGFSAQIASVSGPSGGVANCARRSTGILVDASLNSRKRWMASQGIVKVPGSSTWTFASSTLPPSVRRKRSITCSSLVCGVPNPSTRVRSFSPIVSTTSVSPS